jgi:methionyl-tRNA formyltransferase
MRLVFFGTPDFAVPSLAALLDSHEVMLVVTQPDRPAGRGMAMRPSPVATLAEARDTPVAKPTTLRDGELEGRLAALRPDALVVAAYGRILPVSILGAAARGGINVHASLLPRWRGASPVAAAILAGDERTGVSIMRMEEGLDTGPVYLQRELAIEPSATTGDLTERLARLGAEALIEALPAIHAGAVPTPQGEGSTHAGLVRKSDGDLSWEHPAGHLERAIRAYDPWPGVRVRLGDEQVRLLEGRPLPAWAVDGAGGSPPGAVLGIDWDGIAVMAGDRPFLVQRVQAPGGRPMPASDYARGRPALLGVSHG